MSRKRQDHRVAAGELMSSLFRPIRSKAPGMCCEPIERTLQPPVQSATTVPAQAGGLNA